MKLFRVPNDLKRDKIKNVLVTIGFIITLTAMTLKSTKGILAGHYLAFTLPQFTYITNLFCFIYFTAAFIEVVSGKKIPVIGSREFLLFAFVNISVTFAIYYGLMFPWGNIVHSQHYPTQQEWQNPIVWSELSKPSMSAFASEYMNSVEGTPKGYVFDPKHVQMINHKGNMVSDHALAKLGYAFENLKITNGWKDGIEVLSGKIDWKLATAADLIAHLCAPVFTIGYAIHYFLFISIRRIRQRWVGIYLLFGATYVALAFTIGQKFGIQNYYKFLDVSSGDRGNYFYSLFVALCITIFTYSWAMMFVYLNNYKVHKTIANLHPEFKKIQSDIERIIASAPVDDDHEKNFQQQLDKLTHDVDELNHKKTKK